MQFGFKSHHNTTQSIFLRYKLYRNTIYILIYQYLLYYNTIKVVSILKEIIVRSEYLDKLIAFKDTDLIKIITGIRRCGKSTLMELYQEYLLKHGIDKSQILQLNFEDFSNYKLLNPHSLHEYVLKNIRSDKMNYIFFDEIQNVTDFPAVINSLNLRDNIDLYVTGSNAYMLSSELATYISGRYIEIKMLPLSFKEFISVKNSKYLPELYRDYLESSSFPGALAITDKEDINTYLEGIYNTIVIKDIMKRNNIADPMMLESVVRFVFDNIGNELSTKKIVDTMTSNGRKINIRTVEKYLSALTESFIIYEAKRFNIKGRQHLKTNEKYYAVDIALRGMLLGKSSVDIGHILENVVYLELIRRGYKVFVGKVDDLEVDFVAINNDETVYYQVAATVRDESTLNRELASLMKIKDHYQKFILTLDDDPPADYNGIHRINVLEWLA